MVSDLILIPSVGGCGIEMFFQIYLYITINVHSVLRRDVTKKGRGEEGKRGRGEEGKRGRKNRER